MAENEKKTPETVEAKEEKVAKAEKKAVKENKPSIFSRAFAWLRTTKAELKKIVWTPRKTVLKNTAVVLVAMVVMGAAIALLDAAFRGAIDGLARFI